MNCSADIISIELAVVFGTAIGLEREFGGKSAGLRTNVLICLGATVFTLISQHIAGPSDSLARIVGQVATGVGFLGAGAIIQDRGGVYGLTTAATIWLVAAIGVACGAHHYLLAAITTLVAFGILFGLGRLEKPLHRYIDKHKKPSVLP